MKLRVGWDLPDLVIVDTKSAQVVSVVEVKYFEGRANDGKGPIRNAVEQVVRYARGYRPENAWDSLLAHCLIIPFYSFLSALLHVQPGVPCVLDYTALRNDLLIDEWALGLLADSTCLSTEHGATELAVKV
jgi:hypothetical protein